MALLDSNSVELLLLLYSALSTLFLYIPIVAFLKSFDSNNASNTVNNEQKNSVEHEEKKKIEDRAVESPASVQHEITKSRRKVSFAEEVKRKTPEASNSTPVPSIEVTSPTPVPKRKVASEISFEDIVAQVENRTSAPPTVLHSILKKPTTTTETSAPAERPPEPQKQPKGNKREGKEESSQEGVSLEKPNFEEEPLTGFGRPAKKPAAPASAPPTATSTEVSPKPETQHHAESDTFVMTHRKLVLFPQQLKLKMTDLVHVDLSHNCLRSLPPYFIEGMKKLKTLNLSHNLLFELPAETKFPVLEELNLSNNKFEYMPNCITNNLSKTLKRFHINNNFLVILPDEISKMTNLEELDISHNALSKLPEHLAANGFGEKLKRLGIHHNKFINQVSNILAKIYEKNPELQHQMLLDEQADTTSIRSRLSVVSGDFSPIAPQGQAQQQTTTVVVEEITEKEVKEEPKEQPQPQASAEKETHNIEQMNNRVYALTELIESEKRYTKFLLMLYQQYYTPIMGLLGQKCMPLAMQGEEPVKQYLDFSKIEPSKYQQMKRIFPTDLMTIVAFNIQLYSALLPVIPLGENPVKIAEAKIGPLFTTWAPYLKMYANYMAGFEKATIELVDLVNTCPAFQQILDHGKYDIAECQGLDLNSLLIMPVQRVPRYSLLLESILKYTMPEHQDYAKLKEAIVMVKKIADQINARIAETSNRMKVRDVQDQLGLILVQPSRYFIREGTLASYTTKSEYQAYLFNDMFILKPYTSMFSRVSRIFSSKDLIRRYSLREAEVNPGTGGTSLTRSPSFRVREQAENASSEDLEKMSLVLVASKIKGKEGEEKFSTKKKVILTATSVPLAQAWLKDLTRIIESYKTNLLASPKK